MPHCGSTGASSPFTSPLDSHTVGGRSGPVRSWHSPFFSLLQSGKARNFSEFGRRAGISTVRVSQIMKLLNLAPAIQERVLFMTAEQDEVSELILRQAARNRMAPPVEDANVLS